MKSKKGKALCSASNCRTINQEACSRNNVGRPDIIRHVNFTIFVFLLLKNGNKYGMMQVERDRCWTHRPLAYRLPL